MKRTFILGTVFAAVLPLVGAATSSPYGICAHFDNPGSMRGPNVYWDRGDEAAKLIRAAGIRSVRIDLPWDACSRQEGVWDYTRTDRAVDVCVTNGLEPICVLDYSTDYANPAHEHPEAWRTYVRNVVGRYRDRVRVWEVWNEENCGFWKPVPDAHAYGKFLKLTYETVKAVDPTAKVALGGTTGVDLDFIGTLQKDGMNRYYDICCVHPYFDPYDPEHNVDDRIVRLRAQMDASGDAGKPIWITEFGMPTAPTPHARNTGNIAAGLAAVGFADRPLKVLYWHGGRDGTALREDDPFLYMYKMDFPKGSEFDIVGLESFPAALAKKGRYDAVVLARAECYPAKAQQGLFEFVRDGGLLVCVGGSALWYPVRIEANGIERREPTEQYNSWVLRNQQLHFELDAWFLNKRIPQRPGDEYPAKPTQALWKYRPNEQICHRFFRPNGLKPGDRWIPLLKSDMGNGYVADGVVAVKYGSDIKGALLMSGIMDRQGSRICSLERQAKVLARANLIALACGVERVCWYELIAHENDDGDCEEHFGIVHRDLRPKPAYLAYKTLTALRPAGSVCGETLAEFGNGVYSPRWKRPDGSPAGAIWNVSRPGRYKVTFRKGAPEFVDVLGRPIPCELRNRVVELKLGDSPIYYSGDEIESVAPAEMRVSAFASPNVVECGLDAYRAALPLGAWYDVSTVTVNKNGEKVALKRRTMRTGETTFRGRLNVLLRRLKDEDPEREIVLVPPAAAGDGVSVTNGAGFAVADYAAVVREAGNVWAVRVEDAPDAGQNPLGATGLNDWRGRRVAFLGDSITDAHHIGCTSNYWNFLARDLGIVPLVYGINGHQWKQVRAQAMRLFAEHPDGVDAITVFAGTNDYNANVPLGGWADGDISFRGRIGTVMDYLTAHYPDKTIWLMTPIHRGYAEFGKTNVQPDETYSNRIGLWIDDYVGVIKEAAAKWPAARLIDLNAESGLYPLLNSQTRFFHDAKTDRLHPNTAGHARLAKVIARHFTTCDATALVQSRIAALPQEGGTVRLTRGVYHFYENGARPMTLNPSNNQRGEKRVVFPLTGRRNVSVDGSGSTFVFHGQAFPFAATNCADITFRNFTVTTRYPSCAGFVVTEKSDAGFTVKFDDGVLDFRIFP